MNPTEFTAFTKRKRALFFTMYPNPASPARRYWKSAVAHAANACEDGDWNPTVFTEAAVRIDKYLSV